MDRSPRVFAYEKPSEGLNIVYLTTEAVPFAKTGGLADVCGALPSRVSALGHQAAVIMPAFRSVRQSSAIIESTDISFAISMSPSKLVGCRLLKGKLPDGDVPVWFIDQPQYFDRDSLYGTPAGDFPDNAERFAFFCRAALQAILRIGWSVDIVHCNDWQTGLVPALMAADPQPPPWMRKAATVMTIHNLGLPGPVSSRSVWLDWARLETLQPPRVRVLRSDEFFEDGHRDVGHDHHGQPTVLAGDSHPAAWLWTRRRTSRRGRSGRRNHQRDRPSDLEPGDRPELVCQLRRRFLA